MAGHPNTSSRVEFRGARPEYPRLRDRRRQNAERVWRTVGIWNQALEALCLTAKSKLLSRRKPIRLSWFLAQFLKRNRGHRPRREQFVPARRGGRKTLREKTLLVAAN